MKEYTKDLIISGAIIACIFAASYAVAGNADAKEENLMYRLRQNTECGVYARQSGYEKFADRMSDAIATYPEAFDAPIAYYYGYAKGLVVAHAQWARHNKPALTESQALRIAAKVLFDAHYCIEITDNDL